MLLCKFAVLDNSYVYFVSETSYKIVLAFNILSKTEYGINPRETVDFAGFRKLTNGAIVYPKESYYDCLWYDNFETLDIIQPPYILDMLKINDYENIKLFNNIILYGIKDNRIRIYAKSKDIKFYNREVKYRVDKDLLDYNVCILNSNFTDIIENIHGLYLKLGEKHFIFTKSCLLSLNLCEHHKVEVFNDEKVWLTDGSFIKIQDSKKICNLVIDVNPMLIIY